MFCRLDSLLGSRDTKNFPLFRNSGDVAVSLSHSSSPLSACVTGPRFIRPALRDFFYSEFRLPRTIYIPASDSSHLIVVIRSRRLCRCRHSLNVYVVNFTEIFELLHSPAMYLSPERQHQSIYYYILRNRNGYSRRIPPGFRESAK